MSSHVLMTLAEGLPTVSVLSAVFVAAWLIVNRDKDAAIRDRALTIITVWVCSAALISFATRLFSDDPAFLANPGATNSVFLVTTYILIAGVVPALLLISASNPKRGR